MRISALFAVLAIFLASCGPDLKNLETLKIPKISGKPSQKMLVMETRGDPSRTKDVGKLFQIYFKLQFKGKSMEAPRARWPKPFDTPRSEWVGYWALPVGEEVTDLPAGTPTNIQLETWQYGQVAEILHIGPYSTEMPDIERLYQFISSSGYKIIPPHEEEYVVGPGMFGPGNPEKYYTIIRYRVEPATSRIK
jgi:hypothetical protein